MHIIWNNDERYHFRDKSRYLRAYCLNTCNAYDEILRVIAMDAEE